MDRDCRGPRIFQLKGVASKGKYHHGPSYRGLRRGIGTLIAHLSFRKSQACLLKGK